jgi:hypothetical protein
MQFECCFFSAPHRNSNRIGAFGDTVCHAWESGNFLRLTYKVLTVKHVGKLGDIVYSMAAMRGHFIETGEQSHVLLLPGYGDFNFTEEVAKQAISLLKSQEYVAEAEVTAIQDCLDSGDMRAWFERYRDMKTNIAVSICRYLKVDEKYARPPWIFLDASETSGVIANWTGSYAGWLPEAFWVDVQAKYTLDAFVGTREEYQRFCDTHWGGKPAELRLKESEDLLDLARFIKGCACFVGNQSCPLAVANALGMPVTVEVSKKFPDCIFKRDGAEYPGVPYYILDRPAFNSES